MSFRAFARSGSPIVRLFLVLAVFFVLHTEAHAKGGKKGSVSVSTTAPSAPDFDADEVKEQLEEAHAQVAKQIPICKVIHSFRGSPCGVKVIAEKIVPKLFPFSLSKFPVNSTTIANLHNMAAQFGIGNEDFAPKDQFEIDLRISSVKVGAVSTENSDAIAIDGVLEVNITSNVTGGLKSIKALVDFSGAIVLNFFPTVEQCASEGGKTAKIYVTPLIFSIKVREFETVRPTWTRIFSSDKAAKWMLNALLSTGPAIVLGVDAYQGLSRLIKEKKFQPGFEVCIGSPADCKRTTAPAKAPATFHLQVGEFGQIDLTTGVPEKPAVDMSGSLMCTAIKVATANAECRAPLYGKILRDMTPLTIPLPREILRGVAKKEGLAPVDIEIGKLDMTKFDVATSGELSIVAKVSDLKIMNATPGNKDAPLVVGASVNLHVTPSCDGGSFKLSLAGTRILNIETSATLPRWMQEGFGKSAINAYLPVIKMCFEPQKIPMSDQTLDLCTLTDRLLKNKSTGKLANIFADGVLPITIEPGTLIAADKATPASKAFLEGLAITASNPRVSSGKDVSVSIDIGVKKGSESMVLKGTTIKISSSANCKKRGGSIQLVPSIDTVAKNEITIPKWLIGGSLVQLANDSFERKPPLICIAGACKAEKVEPAPPSASTLVPTRVSTECGGH